MKDRTRALFSVAVLAAVICLNVQQFKNHRDLAKTAIALEQLDVKTIDLKKTLSITKALNESNMVELARQKQSLGKITAADKNLILRTADLGFRFGEQGHSLEELHVVILETLNRYPEP